MCRRWQLKTTHARSSTWRQESVVHRHHIYKWIWTMYVYLIINCMLKENLQFTISRRSQLKLILQYVSVCHSISDSTWSVPRLPLHPLLPLVRVFPYVTVTLTVRALFMDFPQSIPVTLTVCVLPLSLMIMMRN